MNPGLVSIGIPAYNRPEGLRQTIASLLAQTYSRWEMVISNDCSPFPGTREAGEEFARKDPRIRYVDHPINRGGFFNFGFVLEQARGEFFMWAADDDAWDCRFLETCLGHLCAHPSCGLVFTGYEIYSPLDKKTVRLNHNHYLRSPRRKAHFLLLDEILTHKANMSYGLWRTDVARRVMRRAKDCGLCQAHMGKGFDQAFLLVTLNETEVFQIQQVLFTKRYMERLIPGSKRQLARTGWSNLKRALRGLRILRYAREAHADTQAYLAVIKKVYGPPDTAFLPLVFFLKRLSYLFFRHVL